MKNTWHGEQGDKLGIKALRLVVEEYLFHCMDFNGYLEVEPATKQDKLTFIYNTFKHEIGDNNNHGIKVIGIINAFSNHLAGLPSIINTDYYNSDVLTIGHKWGLLDLNASEDKECDFLNDWFSFLSRHLVRVLHKYKVNTNEL